MDSAVIEVAINDLARIYEANNKTMDFSNDSSSCSSSEAILGAFHRVREISSKSKIDAAVALAKDVLGKENAVVIFTVFVSVAEAVAEKLIECGWTGESFTGKTRQNKRQPIVDNFQNGLSSFFVCTFGVGGVGLNLTAAATIILLDRPWTPGEAFQAEDRVRRIGQTKPVTSIWLRAFLIDEQIDSVIDQKKLNSLVVVDRKNKTDHSMKNTETSNRAPKVSIFRLIKSFVPQKQKTIQTLLRDVNNEGGFL